MDDQICRCTAGHLFSAPPIKLHLLSVHLIDGRWTRCPVDGKWRIIRTLNRNTLTDVEIEQAKQARF